MTNRNSTLMNTRGGEFTILAPDGQVRTRGTLVDGGLIDAIEATLEDVSPR
jgi:hypothetical protein